MRKRQSLCGAWQWRALDEKQLHDGSVPGSVIADMLREGIIEDPYWRCNEYAIRERMMKDFLYRRTFTVQEDVGAMDEVQLVCEGLDTIAEIRLNGRTVAKTDDMHRVYRFPVRGLLRTGKNEENEIEILFSSALRFVREEDAQNDIFYASTGSIHGNAALRKAHYMFGWDWGPQLPDAGIFREIYLEYQCAACFEDVRVRQRHRKDGGVSLEISADIHRLSGGDMPLALQAQVTAPDGRPVCEGGAACGTAITLELTDPQLWWPNGLGAQPLYTVAVRLAAPDGTVMDSWEKRIGLRTLTVSTQKDEYGNEFAFVINGVKVFAMGANLIPEDNLLKNVTPQRTRQLISDCAKANFNCVRVWGGGYYPGDALYDACDEYGILVWQDLMFACNVYALTGRFEENIVAETADTVRRLRHHACLALWCGNNEMEWGWNDWQRLHGHHPRYKADYTRIFELILPRVVHKYDGETFYWMSSPSSGGSFDDPNSPDRGDQHYWEVWHSGKPFTEYRTAHFRFCSEYGFQSFPSFKTIESFTLPQDRNIFSEVMESHQKNGTANSKIFTYVADYFLYPKDFDSVCYISQVLQLKAVQYGVEHWRRNRGRCMGSLYWQLNDCWPVASWASIDYYGRWKALHYGARRFYAPLAVSACEREELSPHITYYAHNDTLAARRVTLEVSLIDRDLHVVWETSEQYDIPALQAVPCLPVDFTPYLEQGDKRTLFARCRLFEDGAQVGEEVTLFVKPKHFQYRAPHYTARVRDEGDCFAVQVQADCFCQYAELSFTALDAVFSDNFFHITSPQGVTVTVAKDALPQGVTAGGLEGQLTVRSVADSYSLPQI